MKVKVSVIVPVYKAEKTLRRCVDSILENCYEGVEIILVEDRSPDASWNICDQYSNEYNNIVAIRNEENHGVSYTRNQGLMAAKGKYLLFVDSDDWVEKNYISQLVETAENYDTELVISGYVNHDEVHNGRTDRFDWDGDSLYTEDIHFYSHLKEIYQKRMLQQLWNKIFLREIVEREHISFDETINVGEDFRFILNYIKAMDDSKVVYLNKALYHYIRDNADSLMSKVGYERIEESLLNMELMYRIMGIEESQIQKKMLQESKEQIQVYAYIIMHSKNIDNKEKKKLIYNLTKENPEKLYREQKKLYYKERISRWIHKKR